MSLMRKMNKKYLAFSIVGLFAMVLVSGALLSYYGKIEQTVTVDQGLSVDGESWDTLITESMSTTSLENPVFTSVHYLDNEADVDADVTMTSDCSGAGSCAEIDRKYYTTNLRSGSLVLENKNSGWSVISGDGIQATVNYEFFDGVFDYDLSATGLNDVEYVLIYYADQPDRFTSWGGAPALELGRATASGGIISLTGQSVVIPGGSLPYPNDWNAGENANYCTGTGDNFAHCRGAKIWLIPASDYNGIDKLINWNPTAYLYETDLLGWNHLTGELPNPVEVSANSELDFVIVSEFQVGTYPGTYTLTTEFDLV